MIRESSAKGDERFTVRLEAFSDLVFGFSLSLLATRLEIPNRVEDIFEPTRWLAVIGTFGFVCRFWLEHFRIFRHGFVATMFDAVVNFIFLFAIAVLPYSVQTFLRFQMLLPSFALYVGDFSLILASLALLRVRGLRQRRNDPDVPQRLREWRRSFMQLTISGLMIGLLVALAVHGGSFMEAMKALDVYVAIGVAAIIVVSKVLRRLPSFLA
ncbi:MAG: TMEM175 family protein [Chthoniobacterales bacterium]